MPHPRQLWSVRGGVREEASALVVVDHFRKALRCSLQGESVTSFSNPERPVKNMLEGVYKPKDFSVLLFRVSLVNGDLGELGAELCAGAI